MKCPLCLVSESQPFFKKDDPTFGKKSYFRCDKCSLAFLSPQNHLSVEEEKKRYDLHRNDPSDSDYLDFLNRLAKPLCEKLREGAKGLDFGCGPGPALSTLFQKRGFEADDYDPLYFPDGAKANTLYDFVSCSEVIEHLRSPRDTFLFLNDLLKNGGYLGVMTQIMTDQSQFCDWWYHRDPTHIAFYPKETFDWIADWLSWEVEYPEKNVVIFRKN